MRVLVVVDSGQKALLRRLGEAGLPLAKCVYECELGEAELEKLLGDIGAMELEPQDYVAVFHVCQGCLGKCREFGRRERPLADDWVVL